MISHIRKSWILVIAVCGLLAGQAVADDLRGSKDHPLISRYEGSRIIAYGQKNFDEYDLVLGRQIRDARDNPVAKKSKHLEGKVTRIVYVAPEGRSTLEVMRNYQNALKSAGFETMFSGNKNELGNLFTWLLYKGAKNLGGNNEGGYAFQFPTEQRFVAAHRSNSEAEVYVSVYVAQNGFDYYKSLYHRSVTLLEIIEMEPMQGGKVSIDAATMAKELKKSGKVALYEVTFDFGKVVPKPSSVPALEQMLILLRKDPGLSVYFVGHTDNVGDLEYNLKLSQARADTVVELLESQGLAKGRMIPKGVGPLSPVATNTTDEGRAKNRRVELVQIVKD